MAVFDVSFANKSIGGSGGDAYGTLVDQLTIMEDNLAADGKLSPGDYKLLTDQAQKVYTNPGLSKAQRSNIEVKIAGYKSNSSQVDVANASNVNELNSSAADDQRKASMLLGNSPIDFLKAQAQIQQAKVAQLADAINQMDTAGADSSTQLNAYNTALQDYQDTNAALAYVSSHKAGQAPTSDYGAYVTTNDQGEITDVKVGAVGSQSGYLETNGLYGGLKIYGKLNRTENGKNLFLLGNQKYSAPDIVVPGPDGSMKASTLVNESMQQGKQGTFTSAVSGYSEMDSANTKTQQAIRPGGFAQSSKGFLYQANPDGSFTKYVNPSDEQKQSLGVTNNNVIKIPDSMESSLVPNVKQTVDMSTQPTMPVNPATMGTLNGTPSAVPAAVPPAAPTPFGPPAPGSQPTTPAPGTSSNPSPAAAPTTSRAAGQPTPSSPPTAGNIISKTVQSAQGFLGSLFGK